jgi:acetate---CoA ligase (ADP-forming)
MLETLFNPKSVAVIGASGKDFNLGNRIIKNLVDFGFKGSIYPINPKMDEIRGVKAYKSILEVPTDIDVVHMAIAAPAVPEAIDDCGKKNVKFVILNGGGFAEVGPEGAAIQADCMERAGRHGIRIFGPNCQGIINTDPDSRAYCNFTFTKPEPGGISLVALSGGVAELIHQAFAEMGVGTRMYASNGNACDVSIPEIIRFYGEDEKTKVVVLYVEGIREPRAFMEAVQEVAKKKPVLAMKAGRTTEGARAAASHTGGLAKEDVVTDLIFDKAGILSFRDESELCEAATAFAFQPIPKGNRVGVLTNTGGPAVIATDVLVSEGLTIPELSQRAVDTLKGKLFAEASIHNPLDVLATATGPQFRAALDVMMDEEDIDIVYINFVTPFFVDTDAIAREIAEISSQQRKPIICNLMTDRREWTETVRILKEGGVPCFAFPGKAARALAALTKYAAIRNREVGSVKSFSDVIRRGGTDVLKKPNGRANSMLSCTEVYRILEAYGIPVAEWRVASTADEAVKAADEIGFPVVVKVDSQSVIHKNDAGGVKLDLRDRESVASAVKEIEERIQTEDLRFLVQKYLSNGKELIVGAKSEGDLGHLIMFGMGGIHVGILKDVVFELAPVTNLEAEDMFASLKGTQMLQGVNGDSGVDRERTIEAIQRLSQLVTDFPAIREMDLNPVIAYPAGVFVVDARIGL